MSHPRIFDQARIDGHADGDVQATDTSHIGPNATLTCDPSGSILVYGNSHIDGITLHVWNGQAQFRDASIQSDADYRIIRPTEDPTLWTAHNTHNGTWVVHAGCVHNIPLDKQWDATTAPDNPTPELTATRQTTFDRIRNDHLNP